MILAFRPPRWNTCLTYVTPFPQLHPQLPMSSRVVPLSSVMAADGDVGDVAAFQEGCVFFRGAVLVEDGHVVGGHGVFSFLSFLVWWRGALVRRCCLRARGCTPAHGECEACAVCAGSVVAA